MSQLFWGLVAAAAVTAVGHPSQAPSHPAARPTATAGPEEASGLSPELILRAQEKLGYSGTLLIDGSRRVRVSHGGPTHQRQEFLGPAGEVKDVVVSDGQNRWHYMASEKTVQVRPLEPSQALERRLVLVRRNYRFAVMGQTRQAGRVVLLTQFTPVHRGNLTHRLWVDLETHLPLIVERRAEGGHLVERQEYLHIDYGSHFDPTLFHFRIPDGTRVENASTVLAHGEGAGLMPKGLAFSPQLPRALPEGYQLMGWQYFLGNTHVPTFNWRLHDGLSSVSLFATEARLAPKLPDSAHKLNAEGLTASLLEEHSSRMLTWESHGVSYSLVGHLAPDDMMQVALSTR